MQKRFSFSGQASTRVQLLCFALVLFFLSSCWCFKKKEVVLTVPIFSIPSTHITDEFGYPMNLGRELLREIARREGWSLNEVIVSYQERDSLLHLGAIDLIPLAKIDGISDLRCNRYPVLPAWSVIYTKKGSSIHSKQDLNGKTIGGIEGMTLVRSCSSYFVENNLNSKLRLYDDISSVSRALSGGEVDGVVMGNYFQFSEYYDDEFAVSSISFDSHSLGFSFSDQLPTEIIETIDRYIEKWVDEPNSVYAQLLIKHFNETTQQLVCLDLPDPVKKWLKTNPIIDAVVVDSPPMLIQDESFGAQGIIMEYFKMLAQSVGVQYRELNIDRFTSVDCEYENENTVVLMTSNRRKFRNLQLSEPFFKAEYALAVPIQDYSVSGFSSLNTKKLGLGRGAIQLERLREEYPKLQIQNYPTIADALNSLQKGEIDVAYLPQIYLNSYLRDSEVKGIKQIHTRKDYGFDFCFGIPNRNKELLQLMNHLVVVSGKPFFDKAIFEYSQKSTPRSFSFRQKVYIVCGMLCLILVIVLFFLVRLQRITKKVLLSEAQLKQTARLAKTGEVRINLTKKKLEISNFFLNDFPTKLQQTYSLDELIAFSAFSYRKEQKKYIEQIFEGKKINESTWCFLDTNDNEIWFSLLLSEKKYREQGCEILYGAIQDITDRKNEEEKRKQSEKRFRSIYENSPVGIFFKDEDCPFFLCNKSGEQLLKKKQVAVQHTLGLFRGFHLDAEVLSKIKLEENIVFDCECLDYGKTHFRKEVVKMRSSVSFCKGYRDQQSCFITIVDLSNEFEAYQSVQQDREGMLQVAKQVNFKFWKINLLESYGGKEYKGVFDFNFGQEYQGIQEFLQMIPESERQISFRNIENVLTGEKPSGIHEFESIDSFGKRDLIMSWHTVKHSPETGEVLLQGALHDITEKKLQDREFLLVQDKGKIGFWYLNLKKAMFRGSYGIEKFAADFEIGSAKGLNGINLIAFRFFRRLLKQIELRGGNNEVEFDLDIIDDFGSERIFTISAFAETRDCEVFAWYGMAQEVTVEREASRALDEIKFQQQIILENISNGVVFISPNFQIIWYNNKAKEQFAGALQFGDFCYEAMYGRKQICKNCYCLQTKKKTVKERVRMENGREFVKTSTQCFDSEGVFSGYVQTFNDITKLQNQSKRLEKALEQAEESDRLKSAFLANLSHEIRSPLSNITGFSRLLISPKFSERKRKEFVELIEYNQENLLGLIDDVLHLAKIESGTLQLEKELVDVDQLCVALIRSFSVGETSEIELEYVPFVHSIQIETDRLRLNQILTNLLANATKFTEKGGIWLYVDLNYEENRVVFKVADTGIGIPKELHQSIFYRFEKGNSRKHGSGLGLSICKALAEALGGEIGVESEPNKGSTFFVSLPLERSSVVAN